MRVITFLKSVAKCVVTKLAFAMVFTKSNGSTLGIKKAKISEIKGVRPLLPVYVLFAVNVRKACLLFKDSKIKISIVSTNCHGICE